MIKYFINYLYGSDPLNGWPYVRSPVANLKSGPDNSVLIIK
jgi:hypothetical protein